MPIAQLRTEADHDGRVVLSPHRRVFLFLSFLAFFSLSGKVAGRGQLRTFVMGASATR